MCVLQRPLDDQAQVRIRVETEAMLGLLRLVEANELDLLWSGALDLEAQRAPMERQRILGPIRALARGTRPNAAGWRRRALELEGTGVHGMDALHISAALELGADRFAICDDRLLSRARVMELGDMRAVSVVELLMEVTA